MTRERTATPGPWEVGYLDHAGQRIVRGEHIEICTCWHHSVGSIEMEMEANAALIAAAPEMLAALKAIAEQETHNIALDPEWPQRIARAAISRAESTALPGQT